MSYSEIQEHKTKELFKEIDLVKDTMNNNVQQIMKNTQDLEVLHDKAVDLESQTNLFRKGATTLKRSMLCKNLKMTICIALIIMIVLAIVITIIVVNVMPKNSN